jgi:threonine/homoserine/homoserine lactone efflux protein
LIEALIKGALAGYAIAIPVGVIAVLIISTATREGFGHGAAAAAGAATADGIYATIASLAGLGVAQLVGPLVTPLKIVGGVLLVAIGARGLVALRSARNPGEPEPQRVDERLRRHTYLSLLALTALNPATIIYFASVTVGFDLEGGVPERLAFSAAAFASSLSWQLVLAGVGTALSRGPAARLRQPTVIFGNFVVIGLGLLILYEALKPG